MEEVVDKLLCSVQLGPKKFGETQMMKDVVPLIFTSALAETFLRHDAIRVTVGSEDLCANHRCVLSVFQFFPNLLPTEYNKLLNVSMRETRFEFTPLNNPIVAPHLKIGSTANGIVSQLS